MSRPAAVAATATAAAPALGPPARPTVLEAFQALLTRDLRVARREVSVPVAGIVVELVLFVFVFTYVLPRIGLAVGGAARAATFSTLLVAGVVGLVVFMQGLQAVTVRSAIEFGYSREIEDQVMAPSPVWAVAVEKVLDGALKAALAGVIVFPIALVIPATPAHLHASWAVVVVVPPAALLASSFGLAVGALVDRGKIQIAYGLIVLPVTFLGAVYCPWATLSPIPWRKVIAQGDPLVYTSQAFRVPAVRSPPHAAGRLGGCHGGGGGLRGAGHPGLLPPGGLVGR